MIVKIYTKELHPGMYVANPGLSQENNPHVYLQEGILSTPEQIQALLSNDMFEVFIDTDKGEYFLRNKQEKVRFETPYTLIATDKPEDVNTSANFDTLLSSLPSAEDHYCSMLEYVKKFTNQLIESRQVDVKTSEDHVHSIIEKSSDAGNALMFLSKLQSYDTYSYTHNLNVAIFSILFGKYIGLGQENLMTIGLAGLFHDIGKIMIPKKILMKPGKLTMPEYAEVKKHPIYSRDMLLKQPNIPEPVVRAVYEHHETYTGGGYPQGLKADRIAPAALLVGIVDTFDALTTDRCYKKAQHPHKALSVIFNLKGSAFSPAMVDRFVKFIGVYPVGSIVVLKNGKRAVVIEQNQASLLRPKIRVVLDENNRYCNFKDIDLLSTPEDESGMKIVDCLSYQECRINVAEFIPGLKNAKVACL